MVGRHAAAQTATVIYLSCDGTMQIGTADTREPASKVGLIINLTEQTVTAFGVVSRIEQPMPPPSRSTVKDLLFTGVEVWNHHRLGRDRPRYRCCDDNNNENVGRSQKSHVALDPRAGLQGHEPPVLR
jgi:hypothetical protein